MHSYPCLGTRQPGPSAAYTWLTFAEVLRRSRLLAAFIAALYPEPATPAAPLRVVVCAENRVEWMLTYFAVVWRSATLVPLHTATGTAHIHTHILTHIPIHTSKHTQHIFATLQRQKLKTQHTSTHSHTPYIELTRAHRPRHACLRPQEGEAAARRLFQRTHGKVSCMLRASDAHSGHACVHSGALSRFYAEFSSVCTATTGAWRRNGA